MLEGGLSDNISLENDGVEPTVSVSGGGVRYTKIGVLQRGWRLMMGV